MQRFFRGKNRLVKVALATHQAEFNGDQGGVVAAWGRGHGDQVRQGNAWVGHFFSSIYNKPLPGLCFLAKVLIEDIRLSENRAGSVIFGDGLAEYLHKKIGKPLFNNIKM